MTDITLPDRATQITDNMASLLTLCAALLACLDEHARREDTPLGAYLPHLRQTADELMALVQVYADNRPVQRQP
jgi:hypothetical protein